MGPRGSRAFFRSETLVGRTLDQSVTHCWVRGHAGVSQGQPEVKFFRNALWPPNLAERTPAQSVMHRWVKGHAGASWGQPEGNCLEMRKAIKGSQCYKALCSCRCSSNILLFNLNPLDTVWILLYLTIIHRTWLCVCLSFNYSFIFAPIFTKFGHPIDMARGSSMKE